MDSQDHRKNHPAGHESHGVHICHRCGWHFPNPHPSAKHRRAHKKVCGKLEGSKLSESGQNTHLANSDEDQLSDEDHKAPVSSKLEESRSNENVKIGIQRKESIRSEEEEFSDAVTEWGDSGICPTIETVVATAGRDPDVNVDADTAQRPEHPKHGSQIQNPAALKGLADDLESSMQFQDHTPSSTGGSLVASVSDKGTESLAVEMTEDRSGSACLVSPAKPEIPVNVFSENTNIQIVENVMDSSVTHIGHDKDAVENDKSNLDSNLPAMAVPPSKPASVATTIESRLQEKNGFAGARISSDFTNSSLRIMEETDLTDRDVDSKEEKTYGSRMPQTDPSPNTCLSMKVEGVGHMGAFLDNAQVKVDSAQEVDIEYLGETVDGCNVKAEVNENTPALSTTAGIPLEGHSKITVKDFEDLGSVKPDLSITPGCGEGIREIEDHPTNPPCEGAHSVFLSSKSDEGADVSSAKQVLEENLQQEGIGSKSMVEEAWIKYKTDTSESKATISIVDGSDELEVLSDAVCSNLTIIHMEKSQMVCSSDKQEPHDSHHESQKIFSENLPVVQACGDALVSPGDTEVHVANNTVSDSDDFPEKVRTSHSGITGKYGGEGVIEEVSTTEKKIAPELATDLCETEPHVQACSQIDESDRNLRELHSDLQDCTDEDFQDIPKDVEFSSSTDSSSVRRIEIQAECVGTNSRVFEPLTEDTKPDHNNVELFQSGAENLMVNEYMPSTMDSECCVPSSVTVEYNIANDLDENASDINSQSLREDGAYYLLKQLGVSAVVPANVSVNSKDQTDCMGVYSGSVLDGGVPSMTDADAAEEQVIVAAKTLPAPDIRVGEEKFKETLGEDSSAKDFSEDASDINSQSLPDEGDKHLPKQQPGDSEVVPADVAVDSSCQTDSMKNNWGSVSDGTFSSMRDATDEPDVLAAEAQPTRDIQGANAEAQKANLEKNISASVEQRYENNILEASSEIQTVQNLQQPNSSSLHAGWVPSLTRVVEESQGRTKNEEVISKVSDVSSEKLHTPLRNLLVEANLESKQKATNTQGHPTPETHKDEASAQENSLSAKTRSPITAPEVYADHAAKGDKEKIWNSPARLPVIKREKRKVRGRQYWVPFVCCLSVKLDS